MLIADSHEFIEVYRGLRDLRMGIEFVRDREDVRFVSFGPDVLSPSDRALRGVSRLDQVELPPLPDRMELRTLPGAVVRFSGGEAGGKFSLMRGYASALAAARPDVILESVYTWLTPRSYATHRVAKRLGVPVIYYDPGDDVAVSPKQAALLPLERPVVADAHRIITFNGCGRRRFTSKYGYPEERISVIPKPVDVHVYRPDIDPAEAKAALGLPPDAFVVAYLGRLAHVKGSRVLADVARRAAGDPALASWRFLFIGSTLDSAEDEADYRLPNTVVTGMLPNERVPAALAAADVVVFPDVTRPGGFWTTIAEAMAAGKPIVLGAPPTQDFVPLADGKTALFVPPSDADPLLEALSRLHDDAALRDGLGMAVGRFASESMDYPRVAGAWLELIDEAVGVHA